MRAQCSLSLAALCLALAAILRIADALDREHLGKVKAARALVDKAKGRLVITVQGDEERELEEWTVGAKAGLFRDVFGLDVTLVDATQSTRNLPAAVEKSK